MDALKLDDFSTDNDLHEYLFEERNRYRLATVDPECRDYADGIQRTMSDESRKLQLGAIDVRDITQNLIGQCLGQIAGRMKFLGYRVDDPKVQDYLDVFATKNQIARAAMAIGKRAQIDGSAAASVMWHGDETGRVRVHHEAWWDGDTGIFLAVTDVGDIQWGLSEFLDRKSVRRRTLYLPDRILKYAMIIDGWTRLEEIPWVKPTRNGLPSDDPLGVPIAYFPNDAPAFGPYAVSTVGQVLAAQDALNASLFNRQVVSALTGSPVYWIAGAKREPDMIAQAAAVWSHSNADTKFGSIPPGDLTQLMNDTDDLRSVVSEAFPVPSYRLGSGDWPSGLALQRSDGPMIARVKLLESLHGPGYVQLAHRATELYNVFGTGDLLDESKMISAEWGAADEIDSGTQVEIDRARAEMMEVVERLTPAAIRILGLFDQEELDNLLADLASRDRLIGDATIAQNF